MYTLLGTAQLNGISALPSNRTGVLLPWVVCIGDVEVDQLKLHRKAVITNTATADGVGRVGIAQFDEVEFGDELSRSRLDAFPVGIGEAASSRCGAVISTSLWPSRVWTVVGTIPSSMYIRVDRLGIPCRLGYSYACGRAVRVARAARLGI
jgi:hypothetical protein